MTTQLPSHQLSTQQRLLLALKQANAKISEVEQEKAEPIAIVGMGCRLPGGVDSPESFWDFLLRAEDVRQDVPRDRWDIDYYYDPDPEKPDKIYVRQAYFLEQPVDQFDPGFFAISGLEASKMDPSQRLLLEVTWEALEQAGIPPDSLRNTATGVFMGQCFNDYQFMSGETHPDHLLDFYQATGSGFSFTAGRIAYTLGLQGPTFCLDTACSSSLVALHLACNSLRSRESNLALVGGVNLMLHPSVTHLFCRGRALSPQGRCASFDASADGYARGEGCGVIVIKRLSDAIASGDNIWSVIRGSAINHDGPSSGLTVPNTQAQQKALTQALQAARLNPLDVDYIECHGTGTPIGDPLEVSALAQIYGQGRSPRQPLTLGSVKTNIGHLEGAAGIASLIKAVLCLHHQQIPANLHFTNPNPQIDWQRLPLAVPTQTHNWSANGQPRRAGVSSFGMSGTNTHVILEEAPVIPAAEVSTDCNRSAHLLTLSAKTADALADLAHSYSQFLATQPELALADVCFTANTGRSPFRYRLAIPAASTQELAAQLEQFKIDAASSNVCQGQVVSGSVPQIAMLFTGQGSQYVGMAQELYDTQPTFKQALDQCTELLDPDLEQPLLEVLYPKSPDSGGNLNQTAYTQPALFAIEYALYQLWRSWGIRPAVVMGHSIGEYVAACVAGVFSLEDGLKLIAMRGKLMQQLPAGGVMASLLAPVAQVRAAIGAYEDVSVAAINGPQSTVISGSAAAVQAVVTQLETV
ncbi:MAG: type I polyketide synthase, partial [Cyanobacteria bacterium P01_H01_bin.121]